MKEDSKYYQKEKELIEGLIAKDSAAFKLLYTQNKDRLTHMVKQNSGSLEDAEDVIQESILILYKKISGEGFELQSALSTFLYGIARRVWLRKLKIKRKKWVTSDANQELSIESDVEEKELAISRMRLYRRMLDQMDSDCRKVLLLFFENFSMEEIAKELNYASAGYAKRKKYICKQKLIERIQNDPLFKELKS